MRDPFPAARINGIMALSATQSFYSLKETANKVMPALCHLTMDPEKTVRDQAFKALKGFIGKLEKVSEDPSLAEQMEADLNSSGSDVTTTNATWASWAVSSLTSKFYRSSASSASVTRTTTTTSSANKPSSSTMGSAAQTQTFSKEKTLDTDVFGNIEKEDPAKTDGWDDEWDGDDNDDDEDDVLEDKPCTPSLSNQTKKESIEKKSGWDDWGSSWTDTTPTKLSTRRKSEVTEDSSSLPSETESRPRVVKGTKGPLKLGAQKISR
jgi:SCY1-like protein 1